jgi:rhodanese-related sulfurtransferase
VRGYSALTSVLAWALGLAAILWLANRLRNWIRAGKPRAVRLLTPRAIAELPAVAIYDVRSHGYHDPGTMRIQGSLRLDPNAIPIALHELPRDREIILYCTCIREATAIRVARELAVHGVTAHVIKGGLSAWKKASMPVEPVPADEVMQLPRFA